MKRTIRRINKALEDPVFRQWWIDQFDKCHVDAESDYKAECEKTRLTVRDRKLVSHNAMVKFIRHLGE